MFGRVASVEVRINSVDIFGQPNIPQDLAAIEVRLGAEPVLVGGTFTLGVLYARTRVGVTFDDAPESGFLAASVNLNIPSSVAYGTQIFATARTVDFTNNQSEDQFSTGFALTPLTSGVDVT